jgi:5-methylcytosine-specific restriction enzyme A
MKYCAEQGCKTLVAKGRYCPDHKRKSKKYKERFRKDKSFYFTKEWKALKAFCYQRDKGCCRRCGKFVFGKSAQHHHIKPRRLYPEFALDPENVMTVCPPCHAILDMENGVNKQPKKEKFNWRL